MSNSPAPAPSTGENAELCWKCQAMLNSTYPESLVDIFDLDDGCISRYIKNADSVEESAANGCLLCFHLIQSMDPEQKLDQLGRLEFKHRLDIYHDANNPPALCLEGQEEGWINLELIPVLQAAPFANHGALEPQTNSEITWKGIAEWMNRCKKTHDMCNKAHLNIPPSLPTRVIDLTSDPAKLLLVNESTPVLPYATLSHCWGSHMPLRLTCTNMSQLQKEIKSAELSKTFLDAFTIARRLGLSYIWVDSLCIIQEGPESELDWEIESSRMLQVYAGSTCNIIAARAVDGTHGCFAERDTRAVKPVVVDLNWGPNPGAYYAVPYLYWMRQVDETPLGRRAWAFQERYLAPRNLIYGKDQVFWECKELFASETFSLGLPPKIALDAPTKTLSPQLDGARYRQSVGDLRAPELDAFSMWDLMVMGYSKLRLTFFKDKLTALSGLAAKVHQYTHSDYIAGMWRKYLAYQLLWYRRGPRDFGFTETLASDVEKTTVPSWSWASRHDGYVISDGCNVLDVDEQDLILQILDAKVDLVNEDHLFGQVKAGGFLRVRGRLAMTGLALGDAIWTAGRAWINPLRVLDGMEIGKANLDDDADVYDEHAHSGLFYVPVRYDSSPGTWKVWWESGNNPSISGLVLRPIHHGTETEFVRVGVFDIWGEEKAEVFRVACRRYTRNRLRKISGLSLGGVEEV